MAFLRRLMGQGAGAEGKQGGILEGGPDPMGGFGGAPEAPQGGLPERADAGDLLGDAAGRGTPGPFPGGLGGDVSRRSPGSPQDARGGESPREGSMASLRERSMATPMRPMVPSPMAGLVSLAGGGMAGGGMRGGGAMMARPHRRLFGRAGGLLEGGLGVQKETGVGSDSIQDLIQMLFGQGGRKGL